MSIPFEGPAWEQSKVVLNGNVFSAWSNLGRAWQLKCTIIILKHSGMEQCRMGKISQLCSWEGDALPGTKQYTQPWSWTGNLSLEVKTPQDQTGSKGQTIASTWLDMLVLKPRSWAISSGFQQKSHWRPLKELLNDDVVLRMMWLRVSWRRWAIFGCNKDVSKQCPCLSLVKFEMNNVSRLVW